MIAMIRRTFDIDRRVAFLVVLVAGLFAARGLFSTRIPGGHDARFYVLRLVEFDFNIRSGLLLPRWAPHLGGGHGEPVWVFVPPLMQSVAEVVHLAGVAPIAAQNIAVILLLLFGGVGMFFAGRELAGNIGGAVAALAFLFAPYILLQIYVRQAASEFAATVMLPWLILGFLRRSPPLIALSIAGVGLSHHVVLLMSFPIALALAMLIGWDAVMACATGLAISAWSWLPALAEKKFVRIDLLTRGYYAFSNHFATPLQILWSRWGYGYSQPGPNDALSLTIGPLLIVAAIVGVVVARRRAWPFAAIGLVGIAMATAISAPLWSAISLLPAIAFPWRFLVLPTVAIPPLCAMATRRWPAIIAAVVAAQAIWYGVHAQPAKYLDQRDSDFAPLQIASRNLLDTSEDEYRPRSVPQVLPFAPSAFDPPLNAEAIAITPVRRAFGAFIPREMALRFNVFGFPGWTVRVDGDEVQWHPAANGLIEFDAPAGRHRLEAIYTETVDRAIADVISLIGIAALAIRWARARRGLPARPG